MIAKRRDWLIALGATTLAWVSAFIGGVADFAAPLLLGSTLWLGFRRSWKPLALFLGTSPFVAASVAAMSVYASGAAYVRTTGYADPRLDNVSPLTGYQTRSRGCLVDGTEWVRDFPHNLTLLALRIVFGPMPGAYDGPYPNDQEISEALREAVPVKLEDLEREVLTANQRTHRLRPGLGDSLISALRLEPGLPRASVSTWEDRVLLMRIDSEFADLSDEPPLVVVIDGKSGKVLGYHGNPKMGHGLPKPWK